MKRVGFTLVEVLIVVTIISVLAAIAIPVLSITRGKARQTSCLSNLRQISSAYALYAQDYDDHFALGVDPSDLYTSGWAGSSKKDLINSLDLLPKVLMPYIKSKDVWRCPSDTGFDWAGPDEELLLPARPSSFAKFGMSYYSRTSLSVYYKSFSGIIGNLDGKEVGSSQIGYLFDGSGSWHGGKGVLRRYNALFVDGHAKSISRSEFEALWRTNL